MKRKRNTRHPNFFIGLFGYLAMYLGVLLHAHGYQVAVPLIIGSLVLAVVHWTKALTDIATDPDLEGDDSRYFWLGIVIMVPPMAGMIYYMIEERRFSF
jgi:hypothetical protein